MEPSLPTPAIAVLSSRYGVAAIFLGSVLEGETAAVTGGLLTHLHLIP